MKVNVLLFASYADVLGRSSVAVDLPEEATVGDVMHRLMSLPGADRLPPAPMVAVNHRYAGLQQRVTANDEVAIIPPVAGG
jgi:molybdopterin converting factor subunit 1